MNRRAILPLVLAALAAGLAPASGPQAPDSALDRFRAPGPSGGAFAAVIRTDGQFHGYTNYWHDLFWNRWQYGNLFQLASPAVVPTILQAKADTAEELGLPGLDMAEGFLSAWIAGPGRRLADPAPAAIEAALRETSGNLVVLAALDGETGKRLAALAGPAADSLAALKSRQLRSRDYRRLRAFVLADGPRRIFAVLAERAEDRDRFLALADEAARVLSGHDLHRGWFGTATLLHSVTCFPGHPLEVIGQGLNQGNDWFTFGGYMDYLMKDQLREWLGEVGLDVVTDVGTGKATHSLGTLGYGCRDWDGLKIQDTPTEEEWIRFVKDRGGYLFRPVFAPECDAYRYDGVIGVEGNKKQVDGEPLPFILNTGFIREEASPAMVLFTPKDRPFTREALWEAILARRAVGVLPQGRMLGEPLYRRALQMLWLDRIYLENRFGDAVQLEAAVEGRGLRLLLANAGRGDIAGTLTVRAAPGVAVGEDAGREIRIAAGAVETAFIPLRPGRQAMGRANPVLVQFAWPGGTKRTLTVLDLPPAISIHKLLYGQAPETAFPVTVHNFTESSGLILDVAAYRTGERKPAWRAARPLRVAPGAWKETELRLPLPPGAYEVVVSALGTEARAQLGVEAAEGKAKVTAVDLDGDGVMEYRMENRRVRATLLAVGARVIEYVVKPKGDNVFFKLWPEKETATDRRPFRERGFYPYGGFEDFLGQASIETHKVYDAEIIRAEGPFVRVRMRADYYGNRLEKIFTLYGDSPLVEVRFALEFQNPELNMIGPQPILELGRSHDPGDLFIVPGRDGLEEYRMRPEEYFGRVLFPREGWNAGTDEAEDVSFIGAFPVGEPEFLHMWMNHPSNGESHHYYAEFQPWVPVFQKSVRYFSYYLWAAPGGWKAALEELRRRNLITRK